MPTKTWRYSIPSTNGLEGWAILFLDDAGCFAAISDWDNWCYRWNMCGMPEGHTLPSFLLTCDDDYLLRKLAPKKEYDCEETLKSVKETILQDRRNGDLFAKHAREEWELLDDCEDLATEYDFTRWLELTSLSSAHELWCDKYDEQAKMFLKHCWPRLKEQIAKDLTPALP